MDSLTAASKYFRSNLLGGDTSSIMIVVLEKLLSALSNAKKSKINKDFEKLEFFVAESIKILDSLRNSVKYEKGNQVVEKLYYIYDQMSFSLNKIVIYDQPAENFDYFIDFTKNYIKIWKEIKNNQNLSTHNSVFDDVINQKH